MLCYWVDFTVRNKDDSWSFHVISDPNIKSERFMLCWAQQVRASMSLQYVSFKECINMALLTSNAQNAISIAMSCFVFHCPCTMSSCTNLVFVCLPLSSCQALLDLCHVLMCLLICPLVIVALLVCLFQVIFKWLQYRSFDSLGVSMASKPMSSVLAMLVSMSSCHYVTLPCHHA